MDGYLPSECGPVEQIMNTKITDVIKWVDGPDECVEAGEGLADGHVADQFRGVDPQLRVVEDRYRNEDRQYHRRC